MHMRARLDSLAAALDPGETYLPAQCPYMRDRVLDQLPFVFVAVILLALQLTRVDMPSPAPTVAPLPTAETAALSPPVPSISRPTTSATARDVSIRACDPNEPRFMGKVALLRAALGQAMGDPVS